VNTRIRVLVVDDQPLIRRALSALLAGFDDLEVVGEAVDGLAAVSAAARHRPDAVVMDVRMPGLDGIEATRRIRAAQPDTAVIVLTTYDVDEYVFDAVRAGASGFLLKDGDADELVRAIRVAVAGEALVAPSSLRRLLLEFARAPLVDEAASARIATLTDREREVLMLMAEGLTNTEIATRIVVSQATVKTHVSSVLAKLGARDRTQAVVLAYESGVVARR
jgi:DNA-binding NarL/FixJ family response regulator